MIGQLEPESEWELARHGRLTASKIAALFTEPKSKADKDAGKLSATAMTYIREKASEIITGTYRAFSNDATEWGNNTEPMAALLIKNEYPDFEYTGKDFVEFTEWSGGSRDGFIPSHNAVVEIKCPENPANHILYCTIKNSEDLLREQKEYWYQLQFNIACVARQMDVNPMDLKGLFVSYSPMPNKGYKQYHKVWIEPDENFHNVVDDVIQKATIELFNQVKMMKNEL